MKIVTLFEKFGKKGSFQASFVPKVFENGAKEVKNKMAFQDQTMTCKDCGSSFVWTAGEQEFYAQKGFDNSPTRCPSCRSAKKAQRGGGGGFGRGPRQMFKAVCAKCGKEAEVPFEPRGDKPVYCNDCFRTQKS